jgi:hypothetical protein
MSFRRLRVLVALSATVGLLCVEPALAVGGHYAVVGGTTRNAVEVRRALNASRFDWSLVRQQITIHVSPGGDSSSYATPGEIWLSPELLATGSFSWGIIQHEYAHQVDFLLLNETQRGVLTQRLHAADWCYGMSGLAHDRYGCERFASTLAWAYWPDARNAQRPTSSSDESAAMNPARFRALLSKMIGFADPFGLKLQRRR